MVSRCEGLSFKVSRFRVFSRFRGGFEVSKFSGFEASRFRGFEVSRFEVQGFEVPRFSRFREGFGVLRFRVFDMFGIFGKSIVRSDLDNSLSAGTTAICCACV